MPGRRFRSYDAVTGWINSIQSGVGGGTARITDSAGALYVSESFSAFGDRRNPGTWSGAPASTDLTKINAVSRRGYTGHEALADLGLTHMNGRVQDAVIGRFLSADPYIAAPGNTQNYNRYSYVNNNPLSFTDPTGFEDYSPGGLGEIIVTAIPWVNVNYLNIGYYSLSTMGIPITPVPYAPGYWSGVWNKDNSITVTATKDKPKKEQGPVIIDGGNPGGTAPTLGGIAGVDDGAGQGKQQGGCKNGFRDATPAEAAAVLAEAKTHEGTPYGLGQNGPPQNIGIDCSGLVQAAIRNSVNPTFANNARLITGNIPSTLAACRT